MYCVRVNVRKQSYDVLIVTYICLVLCVSNLQMTPMLMKRSSKLMNNRVNVKDKEKEKEENEIE